RQLTALGREAAEVDRIVEGERQRRADAVLHQARYGDTQVLHENAGPLPWGEEIAVGVEGGVDLLGSAGAGRVVVEADRLVVGRRRQCRKGRKSRVWSAGAAVAVVGVVVVDAGEEVRLRAARIRRQPARQRGRHRIAHGDLHRAGEGDVVGGGGDEG